MYVPSAQIPYDFLKVTSIADSTRARSVWDSLYNCDKVLEWLDPVTCIVQTKLNAVFPTSAR